MSQKDELIRTLQNDLAQVKVFFLFIINIKWPKIKQFKQKQRVQNDRETLRKIDGEIQESDKKFFQLEDENKELARGNLKK